jgi:hypothetical protein
VLHAAIFQLDYPLHLVLVLLNDDEDSSEHLSASCLQATPAPTSPKDLYVYKTVYLVQVFHYDTSTANVV